MYYSLENHSVIHCGVNVSPKPYLDNELHNKYAQSHNESSSHSILIIITNYVNDVLKSISISTILFKKNSLIF